MGALTSRIIVGLFAVCLHGIMGNSSLERDSQNVTNILNGLLRDYDNRQLPGHFDTTPTIVKADFNIRSMGPISEEDMTYSFDAYFRQTWRDKRLRFNVSGDFEELAVHIKLLEKIWKPDTFFYNARGSYIHTITTPNKLLRIKPDGTILYSMRVTIKASCPMFLHYFPVDAQRCPLQFGSYAFTTKDVVYIWKKGSKNSIAIAKDMRLSQFDLVGFPAGNVTIFNRSGLNYVNRITWRYSLLQWQPSSPYIRHL